MTLYGKAHYLSILYSAKPQANIGLGTTVGALLGTITTCHFTEMAYSLQPVCLQIETALAGLHMRVHIILGIKLLVECLMPVTDFMRGFPLYENQND